MKISDFRFIHSPPTIMAAMTSLLHSDSSRSHDLIYFVCSAGLHLDERKKIMVLQVTLVILQATLIPEGNLLEWFVS